MHITISGVRLYLGMLLVTLILLSSSDTSTASDIPPLNSSVIPGKDSPTVESTEEWIRGDGENLEIRLRGVVLLPSGEPAVSATVTAMLTKNLPETIPVTMTGSQFEVWLPAHRDDWYGVSLMAVSDDKSQRNGMLINRFAVREAAIEGKIITLQHCNRTVTLEVIHNDVPVAGTHVKVVLESGYQLTSLSDQQGKARFDLLPSEKLSAITAWTDDRRIGGYQFSRGPVRDPAADAHVVQLHHCRRQAFHVVDGDGEPLAGVSMQLQIATPPPHYNYLGTLEQSTMVTDDRGVAFFDWFPDWQEVHCYVDIDDARWVQDGKSRWEDDLFVTQVKPRTARKRMSGTIARAMGSKAGFLVQLRSFQGEQERRSDVAAAVTDQDGRFYAEVLPGKTYCVCVNDAAFVSEMIDVIPIRDDGALGDAVNLKFLKASPVTIQVTAGESKRPIADQLLYLRQSHVFTWLENDETKNGIGSRDSWATTDEDGKAIALVEPGKKLEVSIHTPAWSVEEKIDVVQGQPSLLHIHREFDEPRTVLGIVVKGDNKEFDFSSVSVLAGSVDGKVQGTEKVSPRDNGVFSFTTMGSRVGAIAVTDDGKLGGIVTADNPRRLLRLTMKPTIDFRGRLVTAENQPASNRSVLAVVSVEVAQERDQDPLMPLSTRFEWKRFSVTTDDQGYYQLQGLPIGAEVNLSTSKPQQNKPHWLGSVTVTEKSQQETLVRTVPE
ncbi:hypothetical protein [Stieleria varia]|uniref:Nickel uptake substrate-specific transmembrane region n=1 Tax=Stieleria varia TaxID=2528005 RepID=A0A5C6A2Z8_9BACT|nr:hypothetical protein [Stieleria varia]TWT93740.1 hypothetical protein Pla52n_55680 [Stieleria varia]